MRDSLLPSALWLHFHNAIKKAKHRRQTDVFVLIRFMFHLCLNHRKLPQNNKRLRNGLKGCTCIGYWRIQLDIADVKVKLLSFRTCTKLFQVVDIQHTKGYQCATWEWKFLRKRFWHLRIETTTTKLHVLFWGRFAKGSSFIFYFHFAHKPHCRICTSWIRVALLSSQQCINTVHARMFLTF